MKGNSNRGVAQLASASGLGPEGPVFESQYPDKEAIEISIASFFCIFVSNWKSNDTGKRYREVFRDPQSA